MALPTVDDVVEYLGETSHDEEVLEGALAAETASQASTCRIPTPYPDDLREALLRRVARNLALRSVPLSIIEGDSDGSAAFVPRIDPEIRRFEAPWRRLPVG